MTGRGKTVPPQMAAAPRIMLAAILCGFLGKDLPFGSADIIGAMTGLFQREGRVRWRPPILSEGNMGFSMANVLSWTTVKTVAERPRTPGPSFSLSVKPGDPEVRKYLDLYTGRKRSVMQRSLDRMEIYKPMILERLEENGLPEELLYLPLVESEYSPTAVSPVGAVGLWQFMEATGKGYGLKVNYWLDERRDPVKATAAAARHLKDLYQWFDDWSLALAAYNRGLHGVGRDLKKTRSADYSVVSRRNGLPAETREYVPNLMACILIGRDPEAYGFKVNKPLSAEADVVLLDRPLDLRMAARCAGTTEDVLREMNPGLRMWCTPKSDAPVSFRIPSGTKMRFLQNLDRLKDWTPPREELMAKR